MTTEADLVGVEKMKELGYADATIAHARAIFDAMTEFEPADIPTLENTVSYAARDNEGKWWELRSGKWVRYNGPGRVEQLAATE